MTNQQKLPLGIRNNNPGNLRSHMGLRDQYEFNEGFAVFKTPRDGLMAMLKCLWVYYNGMGKRTLAGIITRYAPPTQNDVKAYINSVCKISGLNPLHAETQDMRLDQFGRMFLLASAMVAVENGHPPTDWPSAPIWYPISEWCFAAHLSGIWEHV